MILSLGSVTWNRWRVWQLKSSRLVQGTCMHHDSLWDAYMSNSEKKHMRGKFIIFSSKSEIKLQRCGFCVNISCPILGNNGYFPTIWSGSYLQWFSINHILPPMVLLHCMTRLNNFKNISYAHLSIIINSSPYTNQSKYFLLSCRYL